MNKYYIDKINKTVVLDFEFNDLIVSDIKDCGYKARFNPELKHWVVGVDEYTIPRIQHVIKKYGFKDSKRKEVEYERYDYGIPQDKIESLRKICEEKDFAYTPREYQLEALAFALEKGSLINGDDVGCGKTYESILYAEVSDSFPCLIITPSSVKYNWKEKYEEILKGRRSVSVIESKETKTRKNDWTSDVVVINYDIVGQKGGKIRFNELIDIDWKMTIVDEAHMLKNKDSQRSKAIKKVLKDISKIQFLTGTATMNKPVELWNLLKLTRYDDKVAGDWYSFIRRYCGGYKGKFGWVTDGATNIFELNRLLRETCYMRREKREVLKEMPPVTKQVIHTTFSKSREYKHAVNNLIDYIRETQGSEKAESAMEAEHLVAITLLRKLSIEGKMKFLTQYLKDWKECGEKLVVFGVHKEGLEELSKTFKCPLIAGGVSSKKKQEIVNEWQKSDDVFLFANIASGGTGIDGLQKVCSNMLIVELPWRPSDLEQAIGRLDRSGQTVPTTITFALSEDTIDMDMWEMLASKEAVTEAVNKGIDVAKNKSGMKHVLNNIIKKGKIK